MAGRPRKNLAVLEMTGAVRNHPSRFVDRVEPETKGPIGDPPEEFVRASSDSIKLCALWRKLVAEAPIGLLTVSDREYLAKTCRLGIEAERIGTRNYLRALQLYTAALKGLGMTPEGRAIRGIGGKVSAAKEQVNPLEAFKAKKKAG